VVPRLLLLLVLQLLPLDLDKIYNTYEYKVILSKEIVLPSSFVYIHTNTINLHNILHVNISMQNKALLFGGSANILGASTVSSSFLFSLYFVLFKRDIILRRSFLLSVPKLSVLERVVCRLSFRSVKGVWCYLISFTSWFVERVLWS